MLAYPIVSQIVSGIARAITNMGSVMPSADNSILWSASESDDLLWDATTTSFILWS